MEIMSQYEPLVELTRGGVVECVHFGAMAIVDVSGHVLASAGDPNLFTFPRSSMKPFQVLPFVEEGGVEQFNLTSEELAIMCASHAGTEDHLRVLQSIHQKAGLHESDLQCGTHWPMDRDTADAMRARGEQPTPYRHNCSGKHSGMLAQAVRLGAPLETYLDRAHPVQQRILTTMAEMADLPPQALLFGTDGCSAPVYALSLRAFALATARLCDPAALPPSRARACHQITTAMMANPVMVSGPGRLDTVLMHALRGRGIVKGGAEGFQMIGLLPGALGPGSPALGVAFKISDGDPNRRATHSLVSALLKSLGLRDVLESADFAPFSDPILRNWRGLEIGTIRLARPQYVNWNRA